jgi:hypothetical protein
VATEHVARGVSATRRDGIYDGDGDEEASLTYHKVAFQITEADLPAPRKVRLGGVSSVFAERHRRDATTPPFHNHGQISRQTYRVCRKISCGWCRIEFGTACYSVVKRSSPTTMKAVYISHPPLSEPGRRPGSDASCCVSAITDMMRAAPTEIGDHLGNGTWHVSIRIGHL